MLNTAIIILNFNGTNDTIECIESVLKFTSNEYSIFIWDNNSNPDELEKLQKYLVSNFNVLLDIHSFSSFNDANIFKKITLIKSPKNYGFATANNFVWYKVFRSFNNSLFLNNDTIFDEYSLDNMINFMNLHNEIFALTPVIYNYHDRKKLWNYGGKFTLFGNRKYHSIKKLTHLKSKDLDHFQAEFITGCAMLVRNSFVSEIGFFTNKFFFGEEDFNFCLRAKKAKLKIIVHLKSTLYHKIGSTINRQQKNYNKILLHFLNRLIDMRFFYPLPYWRFWKYIFSFLVSFKFFFIKFDFIKGFKTFFLLIKYSNKDSVSYDDFQFLSKIF
jgi:GT2 family glycosyltransferase